MADADDCVVKSLGGGRSGYSKTAKGSYRERIQRFGINWSRGFFELSSQQQHQHGKRRHCVGENQKKKKWKLCAHHHPTLPMRHSKRKKEKNQISSSLLWHRLKFLT